MNEIVPESRQKILEFEKILGTHPNAVHGDCFPLKHSFADGVYVREIFIPAGAILTGKIHKHSHPNFLMVGKVEVFTEEDGLQILEAPLSMISKAGTKRVVRAITDTIWITVHVTNETDLDKIEDYVIAKSFDDLKLFNENKVRGELCHG